MPAAPEVVVNLLRNHERLVEFADALARLVAGANRVLDCAQVAFVKPLHGLGQARAGTALRTRLTDPPVLPGSVHRLTTFPDVV